MTRRRAKEEEAAPAPASIRFVQITGGADGLYALDGEGRVFFYDDSRPPPDDGWFQLEYDDTRGTEKENVGAVEISSGKENFVQITGGGDRLYAFDAEGRTYLYSESDAGWFQLTFDEERVPLEEEVE